MDILRIVRTRKTAQSEQADVRQIPNAAGGYTFSVDQWSQVHRFLTLGTDGGTYYTTDRGLTRDDAAMVLRAAANDPIGLVSRIVEVSESGRAPRQNPALFALAIAASADDVDGRRAALAALPRVARTVLTSFCSPATSSSSAGGVRRFAGRSPIGTPASRSIGWPTNWSSTASAVGGATATCCGWPVPPASPTRVCEWRSTGPWARAWATTASRRPG